MSGVKTKLIPKIGIILLSISFVSAETLEKNDPPSTGGKNETNCMAECLQERSKLATIYNEKISNGTSSPCTDFFSYACENLQPNKRILVNSQYFQGTESNRLLVETTKKRNQIIRETLNTTDEFLPHKLIETFYKSCENYKNKSSPANSSDVNFLLNQLSKFGGWPVLEGDNWNETAFDWKEIVIELQSMGYLFNAFFYFHIPDKNPFDQYYIQPPPDYSLYPKLTDYNKTQLNTYHDFMVNVSVLLGANETLARKDLQDALDFELNLTIATNKLHHHYSKMSTAEMSDRWPAVNWTEFLTHLSQSQVKFNESTVITVINVNYTDNLMRLISSTPKRVQANYGLWKLVTRFSAVMNEFSFLKLRHTLDSIMSSHSSKFRSPKVICLSIVDKLLPLSVDALYVREFVDKRVKSIADDMYKEIKQKLIDLVRSADWLDEETKRNAVKKVEIISDLIAYPNELLDNQKLEEHYKDLGELVDGGYLENVIRILKFDSRKKLKRQIFGFFEYYQTHPLVMMDQVSKSRASYNFITNKLRITAGYLQGLHFNVNYPSYVNYGAAGTTIGHELTHAYHSNARTTVEYRHGDLKWADSSREEFKNREKCLIEQYSRSIFNGKTVDGERTLNENFADNVGVKIAYLAYQNWAARNGPEQSLPGFESFSPNQLFWLAYANEKCSEYTPSGIDFTMNQDVHSPNYFRVNNVLKNLPEFSRDFNCPPDSPMNPEKKCVLF